MVTVSDLAIAVAEKAGQDLHVMSVSGILDVPMDTVSRYMSRAEIGFHSISISQSLIFDTLLFCL